MVVDLLTAVLVLIVIRAAFRSASVAAKFRAWGERSKREKEALAAAAAQGRTLDFTAEQIRDLDDLPLLVTLVALISVHIAAHRLGVPLASALTFAATYFLGALAAVRWVRLSARRAAAVSLAVVGLVLLLADTVSLERPMSRQALVESVLLGLLVLAPAVRPLRLTHRYHDLLTRGN